MAAAGVLRISGSQFRPDDPIRRDEMAAWMNSTWRWLSGSLATGSSHTFTDIAGNPHAASIAALHPHGVINGRTDTSYAPASPRPEERRAGKECVRTGRCWWSPDH